ncbi:MAG: glycoside hydrolase family 5 protein [Oscillospiraceae bacterium]|nr:glycoside hydrolase family 5 protein [Oscillospiraceae bacterium]
MKKKILSLVMSAVMTLSAGCSAAPKADEGYITATEMADEMGIGLNLGNTMEAYNSNGCETVEYTWIPKCGSNTPTDYEVQWGATVTTQEIIDGIKAAGFDTVRVPVFWGNMMEDDGKYTISPEYMARVREIVDYSQNAGLYCVINIHHFDEFIIRRNSLEECEKIFTDLWTQIAEEFRDYPYTLVFEGFNEYLGGSSFDDSGKLVDPSREDGFKMANTLNQTFVDAVRKTGGNNGERVLIVSGYWTNIDLTSSAEFIVPEDTVENRLMVSVHYVDNAMYWSNKVGGKEWLDYIDSQCELLKKAFTDKGIPVFVGETTSIYPKSNFEPGAVHTESTECLEIVLNRLNDYGFVPVLWDTSNNFYMRVTKQIKNESDRELISRLSEEFRK